MAALDIFEEFIIRWSLRFVYMVQMTSYILIMMLLIPFLGLYLIDAWLYIFRLMVYYYKLHRRAGKKIAEYKDIDTLTSQESIRDDNENTLLNKHINASIQTMIDKIHEYLIVKNEQMKRGKKDKLRTKRLSRDDLIYGTSNDSMIQQNENNNTMTQLQRMVSA
ncbi:hypothetical protein C6P45_004925 [Maudiozyma exigua]|uniref:Uncharacterized protein n=1 Tax=Maudiozyma exigua TaxID=34358 RepID=A0A9P7BA11_MAUEX|nr:hypothetical protein C6P45_004925 [Kazachstania exigua]